MAENNFDELKFSRFFYKNSNEVLKNCKILHKEYSLYPATRVIQRLSNTKENRNLKSFGRIDFVVIYKNYKYVVEVKYSEGNHSSFWEAIKVIGYARYYTYQTGEKVIPAIFMPIEDIKPEHELVCKELKIKLFSITALNYGSGYNIDSYRIREVKNTPNWEEK